MPVFEQSYPRWSPAQRRRLRWRPIIRRELSVLLALLTTITVVYLALRFSGLIARVVRPAGIHLLSRLMGLIAAAIAVQLIASAVQVWVDEGVS